MSPILRIGGQDLAVDSTWVMGVVNASPESFSDAGRFTGLSAQLELAASLIEAGADIVDIGGQSAITNQPELDASIERDRVLPIIEWIRSTYPLTLVSVDTYKPIVVDAALSAGAHIINDVSGLQDPSIAGRCADHGAALVIMHTAAPPKVRLQDTELYGDVASEVLEFITVHMREAVAQGLPADSIIIDPGPDFTKTPHQTIAMLREINRFRALERPLLLALSRKDFLGAITGRTPRARGAATDAAIAHFAVTPGNIVRVHDVVAAVDVIKTTETLAGLREIDVDYCLPDSLRYEPRDE